MLLQEVNWAFANSAYLDAPMFRDKERFAQSTLRGRRDAVLHTVQLPHLTWNYCDYLQTTRIRTALNSVKPLRGLVDARLPVGRSRAFISELRFRDAQGEIVTMTRSEFIQAYIAVCAYATGLRRYALALKEVATNYLGYDIPAIQKGLKGPIGRAEALFKALDRMARYLHASEGDPDPPPEWQTCPLQGQDPWEAAVNCEPEDVQVSDFALRLAHRVRSLGLPLLPDNLIVCNRYRKRFHYTWDLERRFDYHHDISPLFELRYESSDGGHITTRREIRWRKVPKRAEARIGVGELATEIRSSTPVLIRYGNGQSQLWTEFKRAFDMLETAGNITESRIYDDVHQYAAAHSREVDLGKLRSLQMEYMRQLRGLYRVLILAYDYLSYFAFSGSPPPWVPWTGHSVLDDMRADPADLTAIVENGALNDYVFHLAKFVLNQGLPPRPKAVTVTYTKAKAWRKKQLHAEKCKICKKLGRSVSNPDASTFAASHTPATVPGTGVGIDAVMTITVYPDCSHSSPDRGESRSGGGWSSGGGGGGDSGGGGGFSSSGGGDFSSSMF